MMAGFLQISLTNRCNMDCPYCPVAPWRRSAEHKDMSIDTEALKRWLAAKCPPDEWHIELTGGEPLLHEGYGDLCEWLDGQGYIYLTKSNGTKKGRYQASAWHGAPRNPPKHYDAILIIADTDGWVGKLERCERMGIPNGAVAFDNGCNSWANAAAIGERVYEKQAFICPDGKIKPCPGASRMPRWIMGMDDVYDKPSSSQKFCARCKSESDFARFIKIIRPADYAKIGGA